VVVSVGFVVIGATQGALKEEDFFEPAAIEVYDSSNESSLHAE